MREVAEGGKRPQRARWRFDVAGYHGRFTWYELITTDMGAASAFYSRVVGWSARDGL